MFSEIVANSPEDSPWVSVTERIPKENETVLISDGKVVLIAMHRPGSGAYHWDCDTYGLSKDEVSDWMPLPEVPK